MKKAAIILVVLMALAVPASAQFDHLPEYSFLWNTFSSFREIEGFGIVTADYGLAVLEYDSTSEQYHQVNQLLTPTVPYTCKRSGDVLAVQSLLDVMYFVDISDLPNLTLLGEADFPYTLADNLHDFAFKDQSLYIAAGFKGLLRYQLTDYSDPVLVDSNLAGVHNIQVDIYDNEMLVLDDYNAVLRYDLSGPGFGEFVDYLWLPLQAAAFARIDSALVFPLRGRSKAFIGRYGASGPVITDTIPLHIKPQTAMAVDTFFVVLNSETNLMETIGRESHAPLLVSLPQDAEPYLDGAAFARGGENHLVIPSKAGGLYDFNLDTLRKFPDPSKAYNRPGPIVDAYLVDGHVVTGGLNNPFEVYSFGPDSGVVRDTTLYGLDSVGSIFQVGDVSLVLYPEAGLVFVERVTDGSLELFNTIDVGTASVSRDVKFCYTDALDSVDVMLVLGGSHVGMYGVTPEWEGTLIRTFDAGAAVLDAVMFNSFLVFSTADEMLHGYKIYSDSGIYYYWGLSLAEPINNLVATGPRQDPDGAPLPELLLGFSGPDMYTIDVPEVEVASFELTHTYPIDVDGSTVFANGLYTVGDYGMMLLDLAYDPPQLVAQWGLPGDHIALDSNHIVITDGSAIHLYPLAQAESGLIEPQLAKIEDSRLGQNYPNPFNPRTTIDYYLPEPSQVRITILNVLGQTVATLVDRVQTSGPHSVVWDGIDDTGGRVASGVYFYKLSTPDRVETRKMVVLK